MCVLDHTGFFRLVPLVATDHTLDATLVIEEFIHFAEGTPGIVHGSNERLDRLESKAGDRCHKIVE
jgi:hypothetical protein